MGRYSLMSAVVFLMSGTTFEYKDAVLLHHARLQRLVLVFYYTALVPCHWVIQEEITRYAKLRKCPKFGSDHHGSYTAGFIILTSLLGFTGKYAKLHFILDIISCVPSH